MTVAASIPGWLTPIAADLGLAESRGTLHHASVRGGAAPTKHACVQAFEEELAPDGALLFLVEGEPTDAELAGWRDAWWPLVHVIALYRIGPDQIVRETLQGRETLGPTGDAPRGVVLAARPRALVLSPDATQAKFDENAAKWAGDPAGPGYAHHRWMRRYVGHFARERAPRRVLEVGCGPAWVGIEAAALARRASQEPYLAFFDPSPEMVENARRHAREAGLQRFEGRVGFGEAPPFPAEGEEPFDLVISSGVISFSPDHEAWLDGLARTVAPGGTLVIGDLNPGSVGMRGRRRRKPLLPVRELNACRREVVRSALEARGFHHERSAGYQLSWPVPQLMHVDEGKLGGVLSPLILFGNRAAAALDRGLRGPFGAAFDSWVMRFSKPSGL